MEGLVFYDDIKGGLSYYNENDQMTVNISQEVIKPIINETAFELTSGQVVYPVGTVGERFSVDLANARETEKCRFIAVMTTDTLPGETGYVTIIGTVGGVDTNGFTKGQYLYLDAANPGAVTSSIPTGGTYPTLIGVVKEVSSAPGVRDGEIEVDKHSELKVGLH